METKMTLFLTAMDIAKFLNRYFVVKIVNDAKNTKEFIVIPKESIEEKIKYYKDAYDKDLRLKSFKSIHIEKYAILSKLSELEKIKSFLEE